MKIKNLYLLLFIPLLFLGSCVSEMDSPEKVDYFDFATVKRYRLDLTYSKINESKILFEIYKENPINVNGKKINNIKPLAKGFTDKNGRANFFVFIPSGLKHFYIYTSDFGVPSLLEAFAENNVIRFVDNSIETKSTGSFGTSSRDNFWNLHIGKWDMNGEPKALMTPDIIPARLLTDVRNTLPEGFSVSATKPYLLTDNASIKVTKEAKVFVTFMHEGAGNKNSMGYFVYPTNNPPTTQAQLNQIAKILVFPNVSYSQEQYGALKSGDKVQLKYPIPNQNNKWSETFPAGTSIGWVMVGDGFEKTSRSKRGSVGADNANNHKFYSISSFNPELSPAEKRHCVILYDELTKYTIIGFEDMLTTEGDNDYNEGLFYASSLPNDAIEHPAHNTEPSTPVETLYTTNYSGTVAFEDLWPYKGDYDMNDVVMEYNIDQVYNQDNKVISASGYYKFVHDGAQLKDGFGFQLGVDDSKIQSFSLNTTYTDPYLFIQRNAKGLEVDQNLATAILFTNAKDVANSSLTDKIFNFNIVFTVPISVSQLMTPPYNPFIFTNSDVNNLSRTREVHLPNYPPTAKADRSLFGLGYDKSNESLGLYYVSEEKFPFSIHIPTSYVVPTEMMRIDAFYPRFNDWVNSFGATNADWYNFPIGSGK